VRPTLVLKMVLVLMLVLELAGLLQCCCHCPAHHQQVMTTGNDHTQHTSCGSVLDWHASSSTGLSMHMHMHMRAECGKH
jgi:hypothetical protein